MINDNECCSLHGHAHHSASQFVDGKGTTLDVCVDTTGISAEVYPDGHVDDLDVPFHQLPELISVLLTGPEDEGMADLSARYSAMFTPPEGTAVGPLREVLWLASAYLHRLVEHRDYETWDEQDCDDVDGMLREITNTAFAVRTALLGQPDCPDRSHYGEQVQAARQASMDGIPARLAEVRSRAVPTVLSGCTCGGIGSTGSHRPPCPWSAR